MVEEKEYMLKKLNIVKQKAQESIGKNHPGYTVKNVIHYNKEIELTNEESGKKEASNLCVILIENPDNNEVYELYYLVNGDKLDNLEIKEVDIRELMKKRELQESIKDAVQETKENEEKPEKEQDKELKKESLEELEEEKKKEEKDKKEKVEEPRKPKYIIQTIETDAYSDNIETIHRAFRLPPNVKRLAFAYPNDEDKSQLGTGATIYMLDENDNIVGDAKEYFKIDDATGKNPTYDDSTELELDETGERHTGKTMRRFRSTQRPDQYLSVKQKEVGQYNEVYADRKKETENASIGTQVETRNVEIQTSLEMQTINSTYKGVFHPDEIDEEVDVHEEHGDDIDKISKKNLDGLEHTKEPCGKNIYMLYECITVLKEEDYIKENFSDDELAKILIFNVEKNPRMTMGEVIAETKKIISNTKDFSDKQQEEIESDIALEEEEDEYSNDGPWRNSTRPL